MLRRNRGKGLCGTRVGALLESTKLTVTWKHRLKIPAGLSLSRASQPAEQVGEFAAQSSCFERVLSSSSSNWSAHVESSSSATWLPDALCGERAPRAGGADESWLSRRPGWQRSWPLQQCNHAETSRGGCRAVAGENEAARFCDFALKAGWPCALDPR